MIETLVANFRVFLLVFARTTALVEVAPITSSQAVPQIAKVGLSLFTSVAVFPWVLSSGYPLPDNVVDFFLLVVGEALIGIVLAFFVNLIFTAFQVGGQFFSLQMGFGASEVFDPLAQVEIPLVGQFFNVGAMFVFLSEHSREPVADSSSA